MTFLYEVLLHLVFALGLPFFLLMGLVRGKYLRNFRERLGFYRTEPRAHDLWIHAVSVGEALAARPVVEWIERLRPGTSIVFTTTTITGQAQARRLYPQATVTYFPLDFAHSVGRCLDHHRPRVFATMETEIWPNVTRLSRARGLRLLLANGRISDRSFPRYRLFKPVVSGVLHTYDTILAREELDRQRFIAIGAEPSRVEVSGNVKFDYVPDDTPLDRSGEIERMIGGRPVLVLGSMIDGEDERVIDAVKTLVADERVFAIVAPRKPERFDPAFRVYAGAGLRTVRRSATGTADADVLLVDTLGELARLYRYATVAFIGGSLMPHGGHNPIEAGAVGVPVAFGPSMSNFREIADLFIRHEAGAVVRSGADLLDFTRRMIGDEALRRAWGDRAREVVLRNRGASEKTARRIIGLLEG